MIKIKLFSILFMAVLPVIANLGYTNFYSATGLPDHDSGNPGPEPGGYYGTLPVRLVYKSDLVYEPGREPAVGYQPTGQTNHAMPEVDQLMDVASPAELPQPEKQGMYFIGAMQEATNLSLRSVVRKSGQLEVGSGVCGMCHNR